MPLNTQSYINFIPECLPTQSNNPSNLDVTTLARTIVMTNLAIVEPGLPAALRSDDIGKPVRQKRLATAVQRASLN